MRRLLFMSQSSAWPEKAVSFLNASWIPRAEKLECYIPWRLDQVGSKSQRHGFIFVSLHNWKQRLRFSHWIHSFIHSLIHSLRESWGERETERNIDMQEKQQSVAFSTGVEPVTFQSTGQRSNHPELNSLFNIYLFITFHLCQLLF